MYRAFLLPALWTALASGCALLPESDHDRDRPDDLNSFAEQFREDLLDHDWQRLLVSSDPDQYRARVVEGETSEPVYLAEVLGLHEAGNDIQEGEELDWDDLARITDVVLNPVDEETPPYRIDGVVTLRDGAQLRLSTEVRQIQGRYVALALAD